MLGERLKTLRNRKNYTQKTLSELTGISQQAIIRYEKTEENNIKIDNLNKLAEALNTTPDYLLGYSNISINDFYSENEEAKIKVPVYGRIPAGTPIEALQVDFGYIDVEATKFKGGKQFIGLKVKGDSMYPFYMEGDIILIELTPDAQSGDDVVAYIGYDHEATLKRFHRKEDHVELEPINREYPRRSYGRQDPPIRILGVVRELRMEIS